MTVRVRFAPSPTGYLHVGGARTALYNWLFARRQGGTFLLRSDDTDRERSTREFYHDIVDGLGWLGLDWDEGIEVGGPHSPYRQSERLERYRTAAEELLSAGRAYLCFCTQNELEQRRKEAVAAARPQGYDGRCRSLAADSARQRRRAGEPAAVRFAVPRPGKTEFEDAVRGEMYFDHEHVDDFVMLRSDGSPTYHLASSVDDLDFGITHVVRGEDLLSSTPKHILIGEALGGGPATYAHLSLLQGPDGQKLAKRHGDTSIRAYREAGYLPEAMLNYLALLGWSPGDDETIVDVDEMIGRFDLSTVSKNPAIFDVEKLQWLNGVYMRQLPPKEFTVRALPMIEADLGRPLVDAERATLDGLASLIQERAKLLSEVPGQVRFVFRERLDYDEESWQRVMGGPEARVAVQGALARLGGVSAWSVELIEAALRGMLDEVGLSARRGLQPIRVAVTGSSVSPPLFESLEAVGQERTLERLREADRRM
ncbi:MAG: glutamate--tRNA ligase [Acidimicrobiia bacterium]